MYLAHPIRKSLAKNNNKASTEGINKREESNVEQGNADSRGVCCAKETGSILSP